MKTIKITVDEEGQIELETSGFKGKSCEQATEAMIKALGMQASSKKKPEFYQEEKPRIHN